MIKPEIEKPIQQLWLKEDSEMIDLINDLENNALNVQKWKFWDEKNQEVLLFTELNKRLGGRLMDKDTHTILVANFKHLPKQMNDLAKDINTILRRFTANLKQKMNFIEQAKAYMDFIERDNQQVQHMRNKLKSEKEKSLALVDQLAFYKKEIQENAIASGTQGMFEELVALKEEMNVMKALIIDSNKKEIIEEETNKIIKKSETPKESVRDKYSQQ